MKTKFVAFINFSLMSQFHCMQDATILSQDQDVPNVECGFVL